MAITAEATDDNEFRCAECGKETAELLVDGTDGTVLEFCSWECLKDYANKKCNQDTAVNRPKWDDSFSHWA